MFLRVRFTTSVTSGGPASALKSCFLKATGMNRSREGGKYREVDRFVQTPWRPVSETYKSKDGVQAENKDILSHKDSVT